MRRSVLLFILLAATAALTQSGESIPMFRPELDYFMDSTLYPGNNTQDRGDSVLMHRRDFVDPRLPLHVEHVTAGIFGRWSGSNFITGLLVGSVLGSLSFLFFSRQRRMAGGKAGPVGDEISGPRTVGSHAGSHSAQLREKPTMFTQTELDLIRLVHERTGKGGTATIEEVNRVLGLTAKNEAVQKKNRSEVISSVNQKWGLLNETDQKLILRKRSEFDRRFFEYYLSAADVSGLFS